MGLSNSKESLPKTTITISNAIAAIEQKKAPPALQETASFTCFKTNWSLIRSLGEGYFGKVYEAKDLSTGSKFAIKVVRFEVANQEFALREVEFSKGIKSSNVVKIFDSEVMDKDPITSLPSKDCKFLVIKMELCQGNLNDILVQLMSNNQTLRIDVIFVWFFKMLDVLCDFEELNLIHRDLKPSNIMIKYEGSSPPELEKIQLKIGDFGLAKKMNEKYSNVGTPIFKALEIIDHDHYDTRADIYSLGMILLQVSLLISEGKLAEKMCTIVSKYEIGNYEHSLWRILQDNKRLNNFFEDVFYDLRDPGTKELLKQMICVVEKRMKATELQNHPVVKTWKKILAYGPNHREIDLFEFNNAPNGNLVILGLVPLIKIVSKPSVVLRSLYVLERIFSDSTKLEERAEYFINNGGIEVVIEYINSLINELVPNIKETSNSKLKKEEIEKIKQKTITNLISTNASINDKIMTGWNLSIKLIGKLLDNSENLGSERLRLLSASLKRSGLFGLISSLRVVDNKDLLAFDIVSSIVKIISFMCKHNISVRSNFARKGFVLALLMLLSDENQDLKGDIIETSALVVPYISDESEKLQLFGFFSFPFLALSMQMAEPSCLIANKTTFQKSIEKLDEGFSGIFLSSTLATLLSSYKQVLGRSYYGLCSNVDRSDEHIKTWWFRCKTCFADDPTLGCCLNCGYNCHFGHDLTLQYSSFYCDCHVGEERIQGHECKCKKTHASVLPHLSSFKLNSSVTEFVSEGLVVPLKDKDKQSDFHIINFADESKLISKQPIVSLKKVNSCAEETIGFFSIKVLSTEFDDLKIGLFSSDSKLIELPEVDKMKSVTYNLSNGSLCIGNSSFLYGPEGSSTCNVGFGLTNMGRFYVIFDNLALPLITHQPLDDGNVFVTISMKGTSVLDFNYNVPVIDVPKTISITLKQVVKNQQDDNTKTLKNPKDNNLKELMEIESNVIGKEIQPILNSPPISPTSSKEQVTNSTNLSSNSSSTSPVIGKKIIVRRYGKKKGGVFLTIRPDSDKEKIVIDTRKKLNEDLIVSLRDENWIEYDCYDDFIQNHVYLALTKDEEVKEGL